jgi:hypothetical protein
MDLSAPTRRSPLPAYRTISTRPKKTIDPVTILPPNMITSRGSKNDRIPPGDGNVPSIVDDDGWKVYSSQKTVIVSKADYSIPVLFEYIDNLILNDIECLTDVIQINNCRHVTIMNGQFTQLNIYNSVVNGLEMDYIDHLDISNNCIVKLTECNIVHSRVL